MLSTSKLFYNPSTAGATDPYFKYVPLLLETTSTNGQQNNTFLDSSTNNFTITRNGTPTQGSVTPYWPNGYWSNNFNGSSDYLTTAANTALALGAGNFTVELWFFKTSTADGAVNDYASAGGFGFVIQNNNVQTFSSVGTVTSFAGTININQWNHVAIVRNSGTLYCYLNGTSIGTPTADAKTYTSPSTLVIGKNAGASLQYFPGYISNLRIVKGTAVYTANFTPSTTPLTAITNTSFLIAQSNRFIDNSTNNFTLTTVGTPRVQAFQPFSPPASYTAAAYGGSGYFNGSTDYLTAPSNAAFAFGTGDFTTEGWFYPTSATSFRYLFSIGSDANFTLALNSGTYTPYFYAGSTIITSSINLIPNQWNHVALVRSGTTATMYINGISGGSATFSASVAAGIVYVGIQSAGSYYFPGYSSNIRFVKGTAVYTANFTPPTTPLTAITNTSLLLNYTNAGIYDAAVQNNAITVGSAQASTTVAKWSPTSMKFNGTTDYLTVPMNPAFALGTGDFTIESWVYTTSSATQRIVSAANGSGQPYEFLLVNSGTNVYLNFYDGAVDTGTGTNYVAQNQWVHVAVTRQGTALRVFINGTIYGSSTNSVNLTNAGVFTIGRYSPSAANYFSGYMQDLRITKGVARYTANFSVPTAAFPTR